MRNFRVYTIAIRHGHNDIGGDCCDLRWDGDGHYVVTDARSPDTARRVTTHGANSPLSLNIEQNSIEPKQRSKGIKEGRVMLTQYKVHPMKSEVQRITSAPPDKKPDTRRRGSGGQSTPLQTHLLVFYITAG